MRRRTLYTGAAVVLLVGAAAAVWFPAPVVSASSLTTPARDVDRVVVQWNRRCTLDGVRLVCPSSYTLLVSAQLDNGAERVLMERTDHSGMRDTFTITRPTCPDALTLVFRVEAEPVAAVERGTAGVGRWRVRCVDETPAQRTERLAFADSFPASTWRVVADAWAYRLPADEMDRMRTRRLRLARTDRDTLDVIDDLVGAANGPDSVRVPTDELHVAPFYFREVCTIARNRYTGRVVLVKGDDRVCARVVDAATAERSV